MTDLYSLFGSDKNLETKGKWVYYGPDEKTASAFLIGRAGGANTKYTKVLAEKLRPYQRLIQQNARKPTTEVLEIITNAQKESFIEACLFDWKNVSFKRDGTPVPFNKENAVALLTEFPDLFADLWAQADSVQTFQLESLEDEAGN